MAQRRTSSQDSNLESDSCTGRSPTNERVRLPSMQTVQPSVPGGGQSSVSAARRFQGLTESDGCCPVRKTLSPTELNRDSRLLNRNAESPMNDFNAKAVPQRTTEDTMEGSGQLRPMPRPHSEYVDGRSFMDRRTVDRQPSPEQMTFDRGGGVVDEVIICRQPSPDEKVFGSGTDVDHVTTGCRSSPERRTLLMYPAQLDTEMVEDRKSSDEESCQSDVTAAMQNWTIEDNDEHDPTPSVDPTVFAQDEDGDTSLHLAIISERIDLALTLIHVAPDILWLDLSNKLKQTPLHLATVRRQPIVIRHLLSSGAKRVVYDRRGNTPLHIACLNGHLDCVQELTSSCPTPVMTSDDLGLNEPNYEGKTCLHLAASENQHDVIRYLVEKYGVNVNQKELRRGCTILHRAVITSNLELLMYLLNLPASAELLLDEPTYDGYTALLMAHLTQQTHIVRMLLSAGAHPVVSDWPPPLA